MASDAVIGSAPATEGWLPQLLQSFQQATADASTSAEDAELLSAIATELADCSARECVTFMLPSLDRHATGEPAAGTQWSVADAALLWGMAITLPNVRPRQRPRTISDCLQALLRRLETAVLAEAAPRGAASSASAAVESASGVAQLSRPETASMARDIKKFVLSAAEALQEPSGGEATSTAVAAFKAASLLQARFVCSALAQLVEAAATLPDRASPAHDSSAVIGSTFGSSSGEEDPLEQAYGHNAALAEALLSTLPRLDCKTTDDLAGMTVSRLSGDESASDEDADAEEQVSLELGQAAIVHAAFCCPDVAMLRLPDHPDSRLTLAIGATQIWLALASEHRSVRIALAALRLASAAGGQVRGTPWPAGTSAAEKLLPAAQQLVMLMVHHGDAGVRGEACRALQSLVRCLNPDAQMDVLEELLGSPYPSVAAVLLQLLRELVAAAAPPPRRALDIAAQWLRVRDSAAIKAIEVAEPTAAALSLFRLLLLRGVVGGDSQLTDMLAPYKLSERVQEISAAATAAMSKCGVSTQRASFGGAPPSAEPDSVVNAQRALERLLEVASRVYELCQQLAK